jgi:hypothetical protein
MSTVNPHLTRNLHDAVVTTNCHHNPHRLLLPRDSTILRTFTSGKHLIESVDTVFADIACRIIMSCMKNNVTTVWR